MMINLVIFGTGKCSERVESVLYKERISIIAYLDNSLEKQSTKRNGKEILPPNKLNSLKYDYIIVSTRRYKEVLKQLQMYHIPEEKIIGYYEDNSLRKSELEEFIDISKWERAVLIDKVDAEMDNIKKIVCVRMENMEYEIAEGIQDKKFFFPSFYSIDTTLKKIIKENCSLCRFGDGEFELMENKARPNFQEVNPKLADRLKEVVTSRQDNVLIAIAKNYGSLEEYTEEAADAIRSYMTRETRDMHLKYLDIGRTYHNAYISRPYMMYKDKEFSAKRFKAIAEIWKERDITIIEGEYTRMGVGNNLFSGAKSINRILAPASNAFSVYDELKKAALQVGKERLFLLALGPTATVLAYDLAQYGYQAIDIGHLDNEYEWYLAGENERTALPYKYVGEICGGEVVGKPDDISYDAEIVEKIICL